MEGEVHLLSYENQGFYDQEKSLILKSVWAHSSFTRLIFLKKEIYP